MIRALGLLSVVALAFACQAPDRNFGAAANECSPDGVSNVAGCPTESMTTDDTKPAERSGEVGADAGSGGVAASFDRSSDGGRTLIDSGYMPVGGERTPIDGGRVGASDSGRSDVDDGDATHPGDGPDGAVVGECAPGAERTVACGRCGESKQTCGDEGEWVESAECGNEGACTPGEQQQGEACERCGTRVRTCLADCTWGEWVCTSSGECEAGEIRLQQDGCDACGEERTRTRTCTQACTWEDWGDWSECAPTSCMLSEVETETRACGYCGQESRSRVCEDECGFSDWSPWGECLGSGACEPGQADTDEQPCGMCGTRRRARSCSEGCSWADWGAWSACTDQGSCAPGQVQHREGTDACGYCGKRLQSRTCSENCTWGEWVNEECRDEGECKAGSSQTRSEDCGCQGTREVVRSCSSACEWGSWNPANCRNETAKITYYADTDGDGYGDPSKPMEVCGEVPTGYVANDEDCCDQDPDAYPGQTEWFTTPTACGDYDYDCDGSESRDRRPPFHEERWCSVNFCEEMSAPTNLTPCGGQYYQKYCYRPGPGACSERTAIDGQTRSCR